jgi:hypothetical protein
MRHTETQALQKSHLECHKGSCQHCANFAAGGHLRYVVGVVVAFPPAEPERRASSLLRADASCASLYSRASRVAYITLDLLVHILRMTYGLKRPY